MQFHLTMRTHRRWCNMVNSMLHIHSDLLCITATYKLSKPIIGSPQLRFREELMCKVTEEETLQQHQPAPAPEAPETMQSRNMFLTNHLLIKENIRRLFLCIYFQLQLWSASMLTCGCGFLVNLINLLNVKICLSNVLSLWFFVKVTTSNEITIDSACKIMYGLYILYPSKFSSKFYSFYQQKFPFASSLLKPCNPCNLLKRCRLLVNKWTSIELVTSFY